MIALNLLSFSLLTLVLISAFFSLEVFTMPIVIGILLKKSYLRLQESIKTLYDTRIKLTADLHDEIGSVLTPVSYTHLDVYKRQTQVPAANAAMARADSMN